MHLRHSAGYTARWCGLLQSGPESSCRYSSLTPAKPARDEWINPLLNCVGNCANHLESVSDPCKAHWVFLPHRKASLVLVRRTQVQPVSLQTRSSPVPG